MFAEVVVNLRHNSPSKTSYTKIKRQKLIQSSIAY
jgi:hypothetical protein